MNNEELDKPIKLDDPKEQDLEKSKILKETQNE
jgi:hypothetical protein